MEGDPWVDDETALENPSLVFSMPDLLKDQERLEAAEHNGVSVQDLGMAAFSQLPRVEQQTLALRFRSFTDRFKERLSQLQRENGQDYVVTKEDVMDINSEIRNQR